MATNVGMKMAKWFKKQKGENVQEGTVELINNKEVKDKILENIYTTALDYVMHCKLLKDVCVASQEFEQAFYWRELENITWTDERKEYFKQNLVIKDGLLKGKI